MVKFNIKIYFKDIFIYEYNSKHDSKIIIDKRIVSVINKGGEIAKTMGIHNCILCGGISKISNITSTYNKECRNIRIDITNIIYKKCGEYDCLYCGKCLGKLNPNSFEYIMKTCGISMDDAKRVLYERNKSPFYAINHKDAESYKKSQIRDKFWYVSQFGEEGISKYEDMCFKSAERMKSLPANLKDSMSIEFHKNKYGDEYMEYYTKRLNSVNMSKESCINRHGYTQGMYIYDKKRYDSAYRKGLR